MAIKPKNTQVKTENQQQQRQTQPQCVCVCVHARVVNCQTSCGSKDQLNLHELIQSKRISHLVDECCRFVCLFVCLLGEQTHNRCFAVLFFFCTWTILNAIRKFT